MTVVERRYGVAGGLAVKAPVRVATTANITLSGLQTIDGVTLVADDRVLVKNQTTTTENGIYVASSGNWTRDKDFNGNLDVVDGTRIFVRAGDSYARTEWVVSASGSVTIGTTSLTFTRLYISGSGEYEIATKSALEVSNVGNDIPSIRTRGYASEGDGGHGLYKRVTSQPSYGGVRSLDRFLPDGTTDATNGGWWVLVDFFPSPLQFGADRTGATDSATALQSYAYFVIENGLAGQAPAGLFLCNSKVTVTATATTYSSIEGAGEDITIFVGGAANSSGVFEFNIISGGGAAASFKLSKVGFRPGMRGSGTACKIATTGATGALKTTVADVDRVRIMPERNVDAYFDTGLHLVNAARCRVTNVRTSGLWGPSFDSDPVTVTSFDHTTDTITSAGHGFIEFEKLTYDDGGGTAPTGLTDGDVYYARTITADTFQISSTPTGTVIDFSSNGTGSAHTFTKEDFADSAEEYKFGTAILLENCYYPELSNINCTRGSLAIDCDGTSQEAMVLNTFVASCKQGVRFRRSSGKQPTVWITDGHCHYRDWGIWVEGAQRVWMENIDLAQSIPAAYAASAPKGIALDTVDGVLIDNITLSHPYSDARHIGIDIDGTDANGVTIRNPYFMGKLATAINIHDGTPSRLRCLNPTYGATSDVTTRYADSTNTLTVTEYGGGASEAGVVNLQAYMASASNSPTYNQTKINPSPAANDIVGVNQYVSTDSAGNNTTYARTRAVITDATNTSEDGRYQIHVMVAGTLTERLRVDSGGIGFNGSAASTPDITGSKGANAALGNLITALANMGLLTDSTT